MKKYLFLLMISAVFNQLLFFSCVRDKEAQNEIIALIRKNLQANEKEDLQAIMQTIHEESPIYKPTQRISKMLFAKYDLHYQLVSAKVLEETPEKARVEFIQITRKVSGPAFKDNKISGIHTLKKSNGRWKIFATEIKNMEYIQ